MSPTRAAPCRRGLRAGVAVATALAALAILLPAGATATVAQSPIALGVFVPETFSHPGRIAAYGRQVGRRPAFVISYKNWSIEPFYEPELERLWRGGSVPLVTWEPQTESGKGIPLRAIVAGRYDTYIRKSAEAAAAWGRPIMLRFAQEMNGGWYPWGYRVNGNTPRQYREAWHHIYWIFRNHGAGNVRWVWSPNEDAGGGHPLAVFYPGDQFVDWVAIDGFCWGGTIGWPSFTTIFASTYDRIVAITSKPVMVAETAAGATGGDKPEWIASALEREAPAFPHLRALAWYNAEDPQADLRVDSSAASLASFRRAISSPLYAGTGATLLATPPSLSAAGPAPSPPSGGYGAPSLLEEWRLKLHGRYLLEAIGIAVAMLAILLAAGLGVRRARRRRAARAGSSA